MKTLHNLVLTTELTLAGLVAIGVVLLTVLHTGIGAIKSAFTPTDHSAEVIAASVECLHRKTELVVCRMHIAATVHLRQSTHWAGIYWGTTSATVSSGGNRVQFIEKLRTMTAADFSYNGSTDTLTCRFPQPVVDTGLVQVQPDPSKIMVHGSNGWALFNKGSVERRAKARLRAAILVQAQRKFLLPLVRSRAEVVIRDFLKLVTHPLNPNLHIRVRFAGP